MLDRSRSGVGAGAGVDIFRTELESLKIRRLRSPGHNDQGQPNLAYNLNTTYHTTYEVHTYYHLHEKA